MTKFKEKDQGRKIWSGSGVPQKNSQRWGLNRAILLHLPKFPNKEGDKKTLL